MAGLWTGLWPGLWTGGLESGFTSGLGPNLWNGILTANQCTGVCRMNWSKCIPNGLSTLARASLVYLTFSVLQEAVPAPVTNRNQLHELAFNEGWVRDRKVSHFIRMNVHHESVGDYGKHFLSRVMFYSRLDFFKESPSSYSIRRQFPRRCSARLL